MLEQIQLAAQSDNERAHHLRDQLWELALETMAHGRLEAQEVANLALKVRSIRFKLGYGG